MASRPTKKKAVAPKKRKVVKAKKKLVIKTVRPKGHWATYRNLQTQVNKAWSEFQSRVKKKAKPEEISRAKNHLLLLLGECNFMAQQCMRLASRSKSR